MANTPFKMKGFGGFGNSPVTKKTKVDDTHQSFHGGKSKEGYVRTDRHIKTTSEKNPADYKRKVYTTKQSKVYSGEGEFLSGGETKSVGVTRTRAKGKGLGYNDDRKIKTKIVDYNIGDGGDITKTVTKSKRKGTARTSQTTTKTKKLGKVGKYFAKKKIKRITKKATKNVQL